jgi:hypothetical protein
MGHYAPECPNKDREENNVSGQQHLINAVCNGDVDGDARLTLFQFTVTGVQLQGSDVVQITQNWIFLDNQSTIDVFSNKLRCCYSKNKTMTINCNAGRATTDQMGELAGYGHVWYHPKGIANMLSLAQVREHSLKVKYDDINNCFEVTKEDGTV